MNPDNLTFNKAKEEKDARIEFLRENRDKMIMKRAEVDLQIKEYDNELNILLPNAFDRLMNVRKKEEIARKDAVNLRKELSKTEDDDKDIESGLEKSPHPIHLYLTEGQKKKVLDIADSLGPTETAEITGISEQSIYNWRRSGCVRKKGSGRPVKYPEFDKELKDYIVSLRDKNIGLSTKRFITYARAKAKKANLKLKFSRGWLQKFMKRHNFSLRKKSTTVHRPKEELDKLCSDYREKIHKTLFSAGTLYDIDHVVNVDETGVPRDSPPSITIERRGTKHVVIANSGKDKEKLTTILAITMTGKRLGQFIILKGKGKKKPKTVVPNDVTITYNEKSSWVTTKIMKEWVGEVLCAHAKKLPVGRRGLLIMDNHSTHVDPGVKEKINFLNYDIFFLPPNCTGRLQPLDIGVNKIYKDLYSEMWQNWFEDIVLNHKDKSNFESPTKELMITWIWKAARKLTDICIQNSFNVFKNIEHLIPERTHI